MENTTDDINKYHASVNAWTDINMKDPERRNPDTQIVSVNNGSE